MRITLLGTGTPAPSLGRQSSGYLFEVGGDLLVMDHGPGAHHRLIERGFRATDVTHAFFSHLHYDHCLDYPRLVLQRWDMGAGQIPELAGVRSAAARAHVQRAAVRRRGCVRSRHPRPHRASEQPRRLYEPRRSAATPAAGSRSGKCGPAT